MDKYIALRNKYLPSEIRIIFVLESPPEGGHGYFYDPAGRTSEVLFRQFMKLINFVPKDKDEGLRELSKRGIVLVDPVYIPVNKLPDKEADKVILSNYDNFLKDLAVLSSGRNIPIILVKANILKLLEKKMLSNGLRVINDGVMIPFPLHYHAALFHQKTLDILSKNNIVI